MNPTPDHPCTDSIVESVVADFRNRSRVGIETYGETLAEAKYSPAVWIEHAQTELMDGVLYLEKLKSPLRDTLMGTLIAWCFFNSIEPTFWDGEIRVCVLTREVSRELVLEPRNYDARVFDYTLFLHAWSPDAKPNYGEISDSAALLTLLNRLIETKKEAQELP